MYGVFLCMLLYLLVMDNKLFSLLELPFNKRGKIWVWVVLLKGRAIYLMGHYQAVLVSLLLVSLLQRATSILESDSRTALCSELEITVENVQGFFSFLLKDARIVLSLSPSLAAHAIVQHCSTHIFPVTMSHFKLLGLDKSGVLGFKVLKTLKLFFPPTHLLLCCTGRIRFRKE